jgi:Trk K+ transport system NAD-binding subunit
MANTQPTPRTRARRHPVWRLVRANFYDLGLLLRESWVVLTGFAALTLLGTLYLRFLSPVRLGFAAALYETLKLLSLQSSLDLPADSLGTALFFLIPLLGLALIFQGVLNFGHLLLDKGGRREAWQLALASTYRDHVILCGLGRVNLRVLMQLLDAGYAAVVVERDWQSEFVERAIGLKVPVVLGDAREPHILRQAGFAHARAVIAGANDDLMNVEIALTARAIRPNIRVIMRVFNEELDRNLERGFGRNTVFSASALAAPTLAAAAVSRAIEYVLPLGEPLLGVAQLTIEADSKLAGFARAVEEANYIRLLHHQDAAGRHPPRDLLRRLERGDRVTAIGSIEAIEALRLQNVPGSKLGFLKPLPPQRPTVQLDTVIVCGLGKVGYRVVHQLHSFRPRPRIVVVYLDSSRGEFLQRIGQLDGVRTVIGDARDPEVLRRASLETAYTVAALTADDGLNLQIGLAARRQRPDVHLVLRVFSDPLAEKLEDLFGIHTAYSTSGLAGPTLAAAAVLGQISYAFTVGRHLFSTDVVTVREDDQLDGKTVEDVRTQHAALVVGLRRGTTHASPLPSLDTVLAPGDQITLLGALDALARMRTTVKYILPDA